MQTWRLIYTGFNNGYYNMAVDEAIAIAVREGKVPSTLRFYTWDPPCISIGYFQKPDESLKGCTVRRITGGRAVFHGNDLSYSVVSGTDNTMFPKNINGTYSAIANALTAGLRLFGINPDPVDVNKSRIDSSADYHKTRLCFNTAIRHEITVYGKKLIGSAQRRWSDVFLQHGSILVNGPCSENGPASISLREILKQVQNDSVDGLVACLSNGFTEALGIQFMTEDISGYELELSENLIVEKYSRL
ncbi:MAG TPA: lipoate--protein ligase family protein [Nitrospirota bacterium]|nr:lipoate--protein ligase family protein [Nitrospirota bacterium]